MRPGGCIGLGSLLVVVAVVTVASGLAAGQDSSDAMWLFVGIGVVLAVVAVSLMIVGAVARGRRISEITSPRHTGISSSGATRMRQMSTLRAG